MDQSRPSTRFAIDSFPDCEEKGSRRFQIFDVVDVATGEVRRDGGHFVEVLKAQGLQGMRPLFVVRRLAETKEVRTPFRSGSHFRSLHSGLLMRVGALHDSFAQGPEVLAALAKPDAPHSRKSCTCLPQQRIDTTSH